MTDASQTKDPNDPVASVDAASTVDAPEATYSPSNPFMTALIASTVIAAIITVILYIVASAQDDVVRQAGIFVAAGTWATWAIIAFLATMIVGGVNWHQSNLKR